MYYVVEVLTTKVQYLFEEDDYQVAYTRAYAHSRQTGCCTEIHNERGQTIETVRVWSDRDFH